MQPNTVRTIASIEEGRLALDMDKKALLYVLTFISPRTRAVAAQRAQKHMFKLGTDAKTAKKPAD
jgi:hypothetical protein